MNTQCGTVKTRFYEPMISRFGQWLGLGSSSYLLGATREIDLKMFLTFS